MYSLATHRYFVVLVIISPYRCCTHGTSVGTVSTIVWSVDLFVFDRDANRRLRLIVSFARCRSHKFVRTRDLVSDRAVAVQKSTTEGTSHRKGVQQGVEPSRKVYDMV